ncbi:5'-nucleotidase C-terminal domain-containing protein [Saccharicrinis aurantiacus]|uniref:5'-nucleotidase C-terminal domain-containing protein n=1 Tax=Saccharicrinis aurantiacus TaxID=1849719 RepID=UPI00094F9280|nr:5'-nucleotidase [Saccharicrinis aurantiacus]
MQKHFTIIATLALLSFSFYSCDNISHKQHYSGQLMSIDSTITGNAVMQDYIKPYQLQLDSQMNRVIGVSSETLIAKKPESPLSNLVADIMQDKTAEYISKNKLESLPLFSLVNTRGLRSDIPKGEVLLRDIYEVMPFENQIVLVKLTGETVLALVDHIVKSKGDGIAGLSFTIEHGEAKNIKLNNKTIDTKAHYYLSTSDYLANGGDNYSMLLNPISRANIELKVREAIVSHIESLSEQNLSIEANNNKRITLLN